MKARAMTQATSYSKSERRATLIAACLASFLTPFMGSSLNVALPVIAETFSVDVIATSWIPTVYLLGAAMFLVPIGKFADRAGRKRIFLIGLFVYALIAFITALSPSINFLLVCRFLHGVSAALIFGTGVAILISVYPASERGKVLGVNSAAVYTGSSIGPFVNGILTQHVSFRAIFALTGILALIGGVLALTLIRNEWKDANKNPFDVLGSAIYALALALFIFGFSRIPRLEGYLCVALAIAGLIVFVIRQLTVPNPLFPVALFAKNTAFAISNLAALINYAATFAIGFLMSYYLQSVRTLTPFQSGLMLISQPVLMAALSPFAGRFSDRVEPRFLATAGMALTAAGLFAFAFLSGTTSFAFIIVTLVVIGAGFALFSSPNTNAVMTSVDQKQYSVASATLSTVRLVGQTMSLAVAQMIFSLTLSEDESGAGLLSGITAAFGVFAALCVLGAFASLFRGNVRKNAYARKTNPALKR